MSKKEQKKDTKVTTVQFKPSVKVEIITKKTKD